MHKIVRKSIASCLTTVFAVFAFIAPVSAYTGTYGILPAPIGGPGSITVTNFSVDTKTTGTQTINMNMFGLLTLPTWL